MAEVSQGGKRKTMSGDNGDTRRRHARKRADRAVCGRVISCSRGQSLLFVRRESDSNLFSNVARNFTLQIKYVANIALILFRPEVLIAGRVDQLRGDADLVAGAQYLAFDYSIDLQLLRNLRQRLGSRFVFRPRCI